MLEESNKQTNTKTHKSSSSGNRARRTRLVIEHRRKETVGRSVSIGSRAKGLLLDGRWRRMMLTRIDSNRTSCMATGRRRHGSRDFSKPETWEKISFWRKEAQISTHLSLSCSLGICWWVEEDWWPVKLADLGLYVSRAEARIVWCVVWAAEEADDGDNGSIVVRLKLEVRGERYSFDLDQQPERGKERERERKTNLVARRGIRLSIVVLIDKAKADKHNRTCKNPNITRLLTFRHQALCFDHYYPSFAFRQRLHHQAQDPSFHVVERLSQADGRSANEVYPRHSFDCSSTTRQSSMKQVDHHSRWSSVSCVEHWQMWMCQY